MLHHLWFVPAVPKIPPSISISTSINTTTNDINLICWLDGFSPKAITVDWGAGNKGTEKKFQTEGKKEFSMLSQISINAQQWNEGKEFTCSATHQAKTYSQTWSICKGHPISKPRIHLEKPPLRSILTDKHVTVSCAVETVFQPKISWLVDGNEKSDQVIISERQGESTVSNLTISVEDWTKWKTITCRAEHPCFKPIKDIIKMTETLQKAPTVVIRRSLADVGKRDSAVLECVASSLPSGELSVTFQANDEKFPEPQYVNLPEGQDTLTTQFTIPKTNQTKNNKFACQIQRSHSGKWKSNFIVNLFDDPSVELSVVSSENKFTSMPQKLLCSATGFNPVIKWLPESVTNNKSDEVTMNKNGRVKVSSELSVIEQEWKCGTTFFCQVNDQGGLKTVQKNTSFCAVTPDHVQSAQVYLLGPSISDMPEEDPVSVTCLLLGHRLEDFSVKCTVGKNQLPLNESQIQKHGNGTESVRKVVKVPADIWKNHKTVLCEVKHPCSNAQTYNISKPKELKRPTIRIRVPSDDELLGSNDAALLCLIDGFFPADISVHWELDDIKLDASRFKNSWPFQFGSVHSYFMQSTLIISPLKKENGTFYCVVRHESSTDPIKTEISNIYASVNKDPPSVKLLRSQDELVCLAYGYSPSAINITWLLNTETVEHNGTSSSAKGSDGKFMIKSHLNVEISKWEPGSKYTCLVQHITGSKYLNVSKAEFIEQAIYIDENSSDVNTVDQAEETWNMACAFIILFVISLIYGCSITLVKVKTA